MAVSAVKSVFVTADTAMAHRDQRPCDPAMDRQAAAFWILPPTHTLNVDSVQGDDCKAKLNVFAFALTSTFSLDAELN